MKINPTRLISTLKELAQFGKLETGVQRLAFSDIDMEARVWFCEKMKQGGLNSFIDNVGNAIGLNPNTEKSVIIGSHLDTVPRGGWLDGAMGAVIGYEIALSALEQGLKLGVDAIGFQDEEGTFLSCLGAKSICQTLDPADVEKSKDAQGIKLTDILTHWKDTLTDQYILDPNRHVAYLEGHIEQGPWLEEEDIRIGVVSGIVGLRRLRVHFVGDANHAGTTPMKLRKDAGMAAIDCAYQLNEQFNQMKLENTVWNFGDFVINNGAVNVVPSNSTLTIEFRDLDDKQLDKMEEVMNTVIEQSAKKFNTEFAIEKNTHDLSSNMDTNIIETLRSVSSQHCPYIDMPSGAGHDAMIFCEKIPTGMIFIPSLNGKSHDVVESSKEEDIILVTQILADTVETLSNQLY